MAACAGATESAAANAVNRRVLVNMTVHFAGDRDAVMGHLAPMMPDIPRPYSPPVGPR